MMTQKEQEAKVYEEFQNIKGITEDLLHRKVSKLNFKQAICDLTKKTAESSETISVLPKESQQKISDFFTNCQYLLGQVIWTEFNNHKNIKISISYSDKPMTVWTLPIDMFFEREDAYSQCSSLLIKSLTDCFFAYFLNPTMRKMVMNGDEEAIKSLYSSFSRPSMDSSYTNLVMLKDNFPDFYKHITQKLDIMTVEDMKMHIASKNKNEKKISKTNGKRANKKK
jgi:hypothetical protein